MSGARSALVAAAERTDTRDRLVLHPLFAGGRAETTSVISHDCDEDTPS